MGLWVTVKYHPEENIVTRGVVSKTNHKATKTKYEKCMNKQNKTKQKQSMLLAIYCQCFPTKNDALTCCECCLKFLQILLKNKANLDIVL
jgi:hypothetical protein